jgi:hypothetical protein
MSTFHQNQDFRMIAQSIHSVFLYAACTADGFVKIGISGAPFERLYQIHCGSPSPVRAAQWVWVGSITKAREIERTMRKEWAARHSRGEWYRFDYAKPEDKADFHNTLSAVVEVVTGKAPTWERLKPEKVAVMLRQAEADAKRKQKPRARPTYRR